MRRTILQAEEELNKAWDELILIVFKSLKIDVFFRWLNKQLIKLAKQRKQ